MHTTHSAGRMRTRVEFRTFPKHCNTCAHFCKPGTQSVSLLFSAQPALCMSCTPPTALITHLAQATPFSVPELTTEGPYSNILAACNAHMVVAFPSQPAARAGHGAAFERRNCIRHPAGFQHGPWRLSREHNRQRRQRRQRQQRRQRRESNGSSTVHGLSCPDAGPVRLFGSFDQPERRA